MAERSASNSGYGAVGVISENYRIVSKNGAILTAKRREKKTTKIVRLLIVNNTIVRLATVNIRFINYLMKCLI